jgi:hypothetical protein
MADWAGWRTGLHRPSPKRGGWYAAGAWAAKDFRSLLHIKKRGITRISRGFTMPCASSRGAQKAEENKAQSPLQLC